jgi:hypothetical protein
VCETGFNGGHSALAFLTARTDVRVVSFDLGKYAVTAAAEKWLRDRFGASRLRVVYGDSRETLPRELASGLQCDLVFVDGGHTFDVALSDLTAFSDAVRASGRGSVPVMVDDTSSRDVQRAMWRMVEDGRFEEGWGLLTVEGVIPQQLEAIFTVRALLQHRMMIHHDDAVVEFRDDSSSRIKRSTLLTGHPLPSLTGSGGIVTIIRHAIAYGRLRGSS